MWAHMKMKTNTHTHIYIYMYMCVFICVHIHTHTDIFMRIMGIHAFAFVCEFFFSEHFSVLGVLGCGWWTLEPKLLPVRFRHSEKSCTARMNGSAALTLAVAMTPSTRSSETCLSDQTQAFCNHAIQTEIDPCNKNASKRS